MKKIIRILTTLAVLAIVGLNAVPAYASDLAQAQYMRNLVVTNSGAETQNNVVTFDPATLEMVTNGLINSSLTGSAITDLAGNDLIYMPKEPVRYKLVQYLESNGTQYIDTGVIPNTNTKWVGVVSFTQSPNAELSGLYDTSNGTAARFDLYSSYNGSIYPLYGNGNITGSNINPAVVGTKYTFVLDAKNQQASVNSASNTAWPALSGTFTRPLYLFARNADGTATGFSHVRIYSSQIYDNGVLIRDFVPVERTTDGTLGLLDRVNNVFYTNKGTGTFSTAQYQNTYYVADYVEFTGANYINPNYTPNNNSDVIVTGSYQSTPTAQSYMLASWDNTSGTINRFYVGTWFSSGRILNMYGTATTNLGYKDLENKVVYTSELNAWRGYGAVNDNVVTFTASGSYSVSVLIGAQNNKNNGTISVAGYSTPRINSLSIINSGSMVRNMIPCYNPTNQKALLLDNVNNQTYYVSGTGDLEYSLSGNDGTWCLYLPTVAANTSLQERLYISTENLNSKITYFPGTSGLVVNRNTSNTVSGSDDWNFTVKGNFISGDGSYLFKYGDDLYAILNGTTVTLGYGTLTIPTTVVNHNTLWAYYWGNSGVTFTANVGGVNNATNNIYSSRTYSNTTPFTALGMTLSNNQYSKMYVRADKQTGTSNYIGYNTTGASSYALTASTSITSSSAITTINLPTGSNVYPVIRTNGTSSVSGQTIFARAYMVAFSKADNPAQYSALTRYGQDATAMINNSTNMLNDLAAVITLTTKCTGDFMWQCIQSSTFTNALNNSPYKSIFTTSEDWAKALAWNTGSYSTTSGDYSVALTATKSIPVGTHTYDFRKEGNAISIYIDGMVVHGGIFDETPLYTGITALGYTYSQLVIYDTDAQIVFAQGGTTLYADQIQQKKNGNNVGQWSWAQTDTFTFPDLSSQGNTGYPSFRDTNYGTVDNGANLSISYGIYQPANVAQYDAPGSSEASTFTGLLPETEQPEQDVDLGRIQNVPFASVFEDLLDAGGIPSQLFWLPIMMTFAIAACGVAYHLTRDALISCITGDVMLGLGCALSVLYTVPLVIGIVTTIVLLVKRKTISL